MGVARGLCLRHGCDRLRQLQLQQRACSSTASSLDQVQQQHPSIAMEGAAVPAEGGSPSSSSSSPPYPHAYRRSVSLPGPIRGMAGAGRWAAGGGGGPTSELDNACRILLTSRRDPSEPIEVTLARAKFPLSASNLPLVLSRLRSPKDALRIFLHFLKLSPTYNPEPSTLQSLCNFWVHEQERFSGFLSVLLELRKPSSTMTPRRLTSIVRLYGWAGLVDDVIDFIRNCKESYGFQPDFFHLSCALHTCTQEGRLDLAVQVFQQMDEDGQTPTLDTFQNLIGGFLSVNEPREAAKALVEMVSRGLIHPGELPARSVSYITIIDALIQSGYLEDARDFLYALHEKGYRPDYITCTNVIKAFSQWGHVDALDQLCDDIRARDLLPNIAQFKSFIDEHCKGNLTAETMQTLDSMAITLGALNHFAHEDSSKAVISSFAPLDSVLESSQRKEASNLTLFDLVIYSLCVHENSTDAYPLFLRMAQDCATTPSPITSMLMFDTLCWSHRYEDAEHVLRMMMQWGHTPSLKMYYSWIQGACKAGLVDKVYSVLNDSNDDSLVLDAVSYNVVVDKLCLAGKLEEAKKVTKEVKRNIGIPDVVSYSKMIHSFAKAGDVEVPRKLLSEMVEMGITPYAAPFNPLIRALCGSGKMEEALALVNEIEAKGCKPVSSFYTAIVRGYCNSKRIQDAFNVMSIVRNKGIEPEKEANKLLFEGLKASRNSKPAVHATPTAANN